MSPREYRSPKRAASASRTRSRIVRAAGRQLRSPGGLKSLSLDSVAQAAGVSRLTVYNQFGSRRGLLEAVFDDLARRGGLHRVPEAMAESQPRVALSRIIAIFCDFWDFDARTLGSIYGAGASDPELGQSMRERNERRRKLLRALLGRMAAAREVRSEAVVDVVDVLFVLTGYGVYVGLANRGRGKQEVCQLIQQLAQAALSR